MAVLRESPTKYIEWQITDFYNIPEETDYCLESPVFSLSGSLWYISIYPNGESKDQTAFRWLGLYLLKKISANDYHVSYRIGIKKADGVELEYFEDEDTFRVDKCGWGTSKLIKCSTLNSTPNVVHSDGSLTVFCNIRILNEPSILPAKEVASETSLSTTITLEATTQTPSQAATLEAASQTSSLDSITEEVSLQSPSLDSMLTLVEDFKNIYNSRLYTDVIFTVKGEQFPVHRNVLAARSSVFASMFEHEFAEKSSGKVEISDCDPGVFNQFLLFLYTGKIDSMTSSKAVHLYVIADKYNVKELKEECVRCMIRDVCIDSFCDVIHLAALHNDSDLLETATDFFINNVESILLTTKWQVFLTEHPLLCNELFIKEIRNRIAKK